MANQINYDDYEYALTAKIQELIPKSEVWFVMDDPSYYGIRVRILDSANYLKFELNIPFQDIVGFRDAQSIHITMLMEELREKYLKHKIPPQQLSKISTSFTT